MQPYLYETGRRQLRLGERARTPTRSQARPATRRTRRALIGDPRNDENLIISQLQVAFIRFHNAVVADVRRRHRSSATDDLFKLAQRTVRWHYQWVVIHDFLRRLVGRRDVIDDILRSEDYRSPAGGSADRRSAHDCSSTTGRSSPFMPVEFSVAAYRFGHSMVRPSYLINDYIES